MPRNNRNTEKAVSERKRGQAAIEFLVTYGWAILGVMIVIGVLSYFGIFNTQRYVSDVCYFGDQLACEDYILYNDSWTYVKLRNNFGVPIDINAFALKSDYGTTTCSTSNVKVGGVTQSTDIQSGGLFEIGCNLTSGRLAVNDKVKYRFIITFNRNGATNYHNQTGDLTVTAQKR